MIKNTEVYNDIIKSLKRHSSREKAEILSRFFKTGPGEYGEGDIFIGVKVPDMRRIAKTYKHVDNKGLLRLIRSSVHEERLTGLLILTYRFEKAEEKEKRSIFDLYMKNTAYINNWDLVDLTAHKIVGGYLQDKDRKILYKLAVSKNLWERRIAVIATFYFIMNRELDDTFRISDILIADKEDLIHKAVGWMLREAGKRDIGKEEKFLKKHYNTMPRTMLRYAIERFPEEKRQSYLKGKT